VGDTEVWADNLPPKDGSEINVGFAGGTKARARWNQTRDRWEVKRSDGDWAGMQYEHGSSEPISWWRDE